MPVTSTHSITGGCAAAEFAQRRMRLSAALGEAGGLVRSAFMAEVGGELSWLEQWYRAQCDGDWEHEWGVRIATLDNPGWTVAIDLEETTLSGRTYDGTDIRRSESDWVMATVSGDVFQASCGPLNLGEVLRLFRDWVTSVSVER